MRVKSLKQPGPEEAQWQIMSLLKPGEVLIWYDRPNLRRASLVPLLSTLLMICWTAISSVLTLAVFGAVDLSGDPGFDFFVGLFGAALTAFGTVLLVTYAWRLVACRSTFYGLTNERLIILIRTWPGQYVSLDSERVEMVEADLDSQRIRIETSSGDQNRRTGFLVFPTDNIPEVTLAIRRVLLPAGKN